MKDRIKIATALGYYARATDPEAATLAKAIEIHALAEYRHDIDCQIAFRKGWQAAEGHIEARGPESAELRALAAELRAMIMDARGGNRAPGYPHPIAYEWDRDSRRKYHALMREIDAAHPRELAAIADRIGAGPRALGVGDTLYRRSLHKFVQTVFGD